MKTANTLAGDRVRNGHIESSRRKLQRSRHFTGTGKRNDTSFLTECHAPSNVYLDTVQARSFEIYAFPEIKAPLCVLISVSSFCIQQSIALAVVRKLVYRFSID